MMAAMPAGRKLLSSVREKREDGKMSTISQTSTLQVRRMRFASFGRLAAIATCLVVGTGALIFLNNGDSTKSSPLTATTAVQKVSPPPLTLYFVVDSDQQERDIESQIENEPGTLAAGVAFRFIVADTEEARETADRLLA